MDQPCFAQFFQHNRHAARLVKVLGHILPTGLEIDEIGCVAENIADIREVKVDPGFVRNRRQMQTCIGGPASAGHDAGRVFKRFAGHDIARANVFRNQVHDGFARGDAILVAAFVGGGRARRIQQRQTNRLGDASHGVCGELAAASTSRRAGHALKHFQLCIRHIARLMLADSLEHVLNSYVLTVQTPRQDRAAIDKDRRHIEAYHGHHHPRQGFVAPRKTDKRVITMPAHGQFNRVGDRLARRKRRAHPLMPHGDTICDSDRGEFARGAIGFLDAELDRLRLTIQRDVARGRLVPAGRDANPGLFDRLFIQPHRIEIGPVRRPCGAFGDVAAGQVCLVDLIFGHLVVSSRMRWKRSK